MANFRARFGIGQVVHHKLFDYRAVVVDVDATFQGSEKWYETVALTRPPRDEPWYHLLVNGGIHRAYAAEKNLEPDLSGEPIEHPEIDSFFAGFENGVYIPHEHFN